MSLPSSPVRPALRALLSLFLLGTGCGGLDSGSGPDTVDAAVPPDLKTSPDLAYDKSLIADRPYQSKEPAGYDPAKAWPLVLALHGLGDTGENFANGSGLVAISDTKGFLLAYPTGRTANLLGQMVNYWNANDVCCGTIDANPPDDVAYLDAVLSDMSARYHVDDKRVYIVGLSNGGFMAHRLACDRASRIAGIVSIAGAQWKDTTKCQPSQPVAVLQLHGTADTTVPYNGGPTLGGLGPVVGSAHDTMAVWVDRNKCQAMAETMLPAIDIDGKLAGNETTLEIWKGCAVGGAAELWTIKGGAHVPTFTMDAPGILYDWLAAHARK